MATEFGAHFNDPGTVARYIGEAVGTHYSAALRAADAYAKYLAQQRDSGEADALEEEGLGAKWMQMLRLMGGYRK